MADWTEGQGKATFLCPSVLNFRIRRNQMIDASMLLHMISALDTLEKLIPAEEAGEYAVKKREWEALKKACWAEYRAKEKSRDRGMGM